MADDKISLDFDLRVAQAQANLIKLKTKAGTATQEMGEQFKKLNKVIANLEVKKAEREISSLKNSVKSFESQGTKSVGRVGEGFKKLSTTASVFAGTLASNVVLSAFSRLTQAARASFQAFKEFDKSLIEISTILPKGTKLTDDLRVSLQKMSTEFGTTQAKQARAFYQIISAGIIDVTAAQKVLTASNKLALGGLADLETTIAAVAKATNVYGGEAGTAADISDTLFRAVELGTTRVEDLASALPQVLSIAKEVGVSFNDAAGAVATLTQKSGSTAIAVTQLRALFNALIKNQDDASKVLGANAELFSIQALKTKRLTNFLKDLTKETKTVSKLGDVLGGRIEGLTAVLNLSGDGFKALERNIKGTNDALGAADRAAAKTKEGLNFKLEKAAAQFEVLTSKAIAFVAPAILSGLTAYGKLFDKIIDSANGTEKALTPMQKLGAEVLKFRTEIKETEARIKSLQENSKIPLIGNFYEGSLEKENANLQITKDLLAITKQDIKDLQKKIRIQVEIENEGKGSEVVLSELEKQRLAVKEAKTKEREFIKRLNEEAALEKEEAALTEAVLEDEKNENNLLKLRANLEAQSKLKKDFSQEDLVLSKKIDAQKKKNDDKAAKDQKNSLASIFSYDRNVSKDRVANLRSTLGSISTLTASSNSTLFAIGKAAAIATATIDGIAGVQKAWSLGPLIGPPLAALVGAATAINIAKISSQKPPAYEYGGMVGGSSFSGDNNLARVNAGEVILNSAQQDNVAEDISSDKGDIVLVVDGREIARAVRNAQEDGFQLLATG